MGSLEEVPKENATPHFPIIDFTPFTQNLSSDSRLKAAQELVKACHEVGFVYITNHGISPALLAEAFSWSKRFFELDVEKRSQAAHPAGSTAFRGWSKVGKEILPPLEGEKKEGVLDYNVSLRFGHTTLFRVGSSERRNAMVLAVMKTSTRLMSGFLNPPYPAFENSPRNSTLSVGNRRSTFSVLLL